MSEREKLYQLLDEMPDTLIAYVQGLTAANHNVPNDDTVADKN